MRICRVLNFCRIPAIAAFVLSLVAAEVRSDDSIAAKIEQAWNARRDRVRTARVWWTSHSRMVPAFSDLQARIRNKALRVVKPGSEDEKREELLKHRLRPVQPVKGFLEYETRHTYLFDGDKVRSETDGMDAYDGAHLIPQHHIAWTNGKLYAELDDGRRTFRWPAGHVYAGRGAIHNETQSAPAVRWTTRPQDLDLVTQIRSGILRVPRQAVRYRGHDCIVLLRTAPENAQEYYLDPVQDYSIVRYKNNHQLDNSLFEITYDWSDEAQVWLPKSWTATGLDQQQKVARITHGTVLRFDVNIDIPENSFEPEFPPGTLLTDQREDNKDFDRQLKAAKYLVLPNGTKRSISKSDLERGYDALVTEAGIPQAP